MCVEVSKVLLLSLISDQACIVYSCQSLKAKIVSLHCFYSMTPGKTSVSIHNKSYVLRDWSLTQSTN